MGIPIEHEHTRDKTLATDIALQHLDEIPDYYTRLKKMEASAKKEHKKFKDVKEDAVTDLQRGITELPDASYDSIDSLMRRIMKKRKMTAKQLHNDFVDKHNQTPDTWAKKNMKEEADDNGFTKCWPGKKKKGFKMKNGKKVNNCVPVKEASEMKRYCPKCQKEEGRDECKYGQKYWDMFSMPITLKDYTPNTPHPGNMPEEKDNNETTIEDANGNTFLRIIDIIRPERLVKETISPNIPGGKSPWNFPVLPKENPENVPLRIIKGKEPKLPLAKGEGGVPNEPWKGYEKKGPYVPAPPREKLNAHYEPEGKTLSEFMSEASAAWQRKEGKNPEGGLNKKGIASYREKHPGSHLSLAVTTDPKKLKPGSKSANRRKSFCSRMKGLKNKLTSKKTANDPNSRINKSLRKWNC